MTPKAKRSELIALRVQHEQNWAYARVLEHMSYHAMRSLANRAPAEGGLGYDLSEHALKSLVKGYRERMTEVLAHDRAELIEREAADLDLQQRQAAQLIALTSKRIAAADEIEALDVHAAKLQLAALTQHRQAGESRRKLYGLDAPTETKLEVTTRDAVTDELNEMLARAGMKPLPVDEPRK